MLIMKERGWWKEGLPRLPSRMEEGRVISLMACILQAASHRNASHRHASYRYRAGALRMNKYGLRDRDYWRISTFAYHNG